MKKLISIALAVAMLIVAMPAIYAQEKTTLDAGDKVNVGTYKGEPVEYKVMGSRDVDGDGTPELFLASSKIISFMRFNSGATANYSTTWKQNNKGRLPTLRVWLNSTAETVDYGTESQNDSTPVADPYGDEGFLSGMDMNELSQIVPVTQRASVMDFYNTEDNDLAIDGGTGFFATYSQGFPQAYTASKSDTDYDSAAYVVTTDRVFIPSLKDLYDFFGGNVNNATALANLNVGATAAAQEELSSYVTAGTVAQTDADTRLGNSQIFLRDIYFNGNLGASRTYMWRGDYVWSNGCNLSDVYGVRPCMYIKADTIVEETAEGNGVYQFKLPIRTSISVTQAGSEVTEVQQGEISIIGSARTSVSSDIIAAVFRRENGADIMEDYVRENVSESIDISLTAKGTGNRYIGVYIWDNTNKCIANAYCIGGTPSAAWFAVDTADEIEAQPAVEGKNITVSGVVPEDSGSNLSVTVKKSNTEFITYINQLSIPQNKGFEFCLGVETLFGGSVDDLIEGWYDITITTANGSKTVKAGIAGAGIWGNLLAQINEGNAEFVTSSFMNSAGYEIEYNSLTDKGFYLDEYKNNSALLDQTVSSLIANKPGGGYTTEGVVAAFNRYMTFAYFDAVSSADKFAIVENDRYDAILGVDGIKELSAYSVVKASGNAEAVFRGVTAQNASTKLYENMIIMALEAAENSTDVKNAIEQNATTIGIQFGTEYYNLSSVKIKTLYDSFLTKPVSNFADIIRIFNAAYAVATAPVKNEGSGSVGGSGSGGSALSTIVSNSQKTELPDKSSIDSAGETKPSEFKDVDKLTWGKEAVLYLADKGIISGNDDGEFKPDDNITREQFAKIAVLAFEVSADGNAKFSDISADEWYVDYINTLATAGIINGVSETRFGVGEYIIRQDLAVIVYRILDRDGQIEKGNELGFADSTDIAEYAREAVAALFTAEFVNGYEDNTFRGSNCITRQETAQIIYNIIGDSK